MTLGGALLPPWFVPLALPCTLVAGNVELRLFEAVARPRALSRASATTLAASRETKIALATMLVASVLTWAIMLSSAR